jgi:hypothetical protein
MICKNCGEKMEVEKDYDPIVDPGKRGELQNALICKCHECGREERRMKRRKPIILCEGAPCVIQKII